MAKIKCGILSRTTGKVGGVVGGSWKGINYIREHVNPANPQTAAQQSQRARMRNAVKLIKPAIATVLNVYVDPLTRRMSGFNRFIKTNINRVPPDGGMANIILTEGKLSPVEVSAIERQDQTTAIINVYVPYTPDAHPTDKVYGVVRDKITGAWYFGAREVNINGEDYVFINVPIAAAANDNNFNAWAWRVRRNGETLVDVSTSVASTITGI